MFLLLYLTIAVAAGAFLCYDINYKVIKTIQCFNGCFLLLTKQKSLRWHLNGFLAICNLINLPPLIRCYSKCNTAIMSLILCY